MECMGMALILLNCGMNGYYLLSVPEQIAKDIDQYRAKFNEWLENPENDHGYWEMVDAEFGRFPALKYDGYEAFPRWLNDYVLMDSEEKAVCLPRLDF